MAKQPCSCTRPLLHSQGWDNSTLRLFDVRNQSHSTLKTLSKSAWKTPSRTSWSSEDEGPSKKLYLVARNRQGNRGSSKAEPSTAPVQLWEWRSAPWQWIRIDFYGPFIGCMFLIVMDAHSRRLEIEKMDTTTSTKTIEKLQSLFTRYGVPSQ